MSGYYLGGYYLINLKSIEFGSQKSKTVLTCSNCINDSLLDNWAYSWDTENNANIEVIKHEYQLRDEDVISIKKWVDDPLNEKKIGLINVFMDLPSAQEYFETFFRHIPGIKIMAVYFADTEIQDLIEDFKPQKETYGQLGLYQNLLKRIPEVDSDKEILMGFDLVGIECDGGFHTFHCHDISQDLIEKFNLEMNQYGLFNDSINWKSVIEYMNAEENGFEPVPWFLCKTKLALI